MKNKLIYLIAVLVFSVSLHGQNGNSSLECSHFIHSDWDDYNLIGKVKALQYEIDRNYNLDSLSFQEEKQLEAANFFALNWLSLGHVSFNTDGLQTRKLRFVRDSLAIKHIAIVANASARERHFDHDTENLDTIVLRKQIIKQTFPIFSPYKLKANHCDRTLEIWRKIPKFQPDTFCYYFKYLINEEMRIKEEIDYSDYGILNRKSNIFDDYGRIIEQKLLIDEDSDELMRSIWITGLNHRQSARSNSDTRYFYKYDEQNRITEAKLTSDNRLLWRENYFYVENRLKPSKLNRFLISDNTSGFYFSDNATEYFNDHGDCIKSEYFDNQGNLIRTRYYEYEYDEVGNWIRCDMYLAGSVEKTVKPTITAYREITYYE